jgi:hypothetical protein
MFKNDHKQTILGHVVLAVLNFHNSKFVFRALQIVSLLQRHQAWHQMSVFIGFLTMVVPLIILILNDLKPLA